MARDGLLDKAKTAAWSAWAWACSASASRPARSDSSARVSSSREPTARSMAGRPSEYRSQAKL